MPSGRRKESLVSRKAARVKYELDDDFAQENGLVCGGQMEVFIEPIEPAPAVYVIGAGHVGYYLAKFAHEAGFLVHVIDDREAFANRERFPDAAEVVVEDVPSWLAAADLPASSYVVIVTRGHRHDLDALRAVIARDLRYVGLIGSRAKVVRLYDVLLGEGVDPERFARDPRPHRPGPRRRHPAGDRGQHPRRADRGAARPGRRSGGGLGVAPLDAEVRALHRRPLRPPSAGASAPPPPWPR